MSVDQEEDGSLERTADDKPFRSPIVIGGFTRSRIWTWLLAVISFVLCGWLSLSLSVLGPQLLFGFLDFFGVSPLVDVAGWLLSLCIPTFMLFLGFMARRRVSSVANFRMVGIAAGTGIVLGSCVALLFSLFLGWGRLFG